MNLLTFSKLILTFLCLVLSINLSNASNKLGNNVNTLNKPNKTPLAITIPKSLPNVNCIVHSTKNPAIVVDELPSKFNLDDWGWVSPLKLQGDNFDCWAFATVASLESALLKSTGVLYDLSPNYVQKLQLKYNQNGDLRNSITGFSYSGLGYD